MDETCIVGSSAGFRLHCMPFYNDGTSNSVGELFNGYDFPGGRAEPLLPWRLSQPCHRRGVLTDASLHFSILNMHNNSGVVRLCIIFI